jgi:hypothetical protein
MHVQLKLYRYLQYKNMNKNLIHWTSYASILFNREQLLQDLLICTAAESAILIKYRRHKVMHI